ncbi:hypothetical protein [Pseudoduganella violaceinigra]|uniref:hypothetical protein n=1 Tax=Pseudoduganella violaceinigra TaxID=246602 RepID=UPI000421817E|nr:hypothetical protein [Pseudoduganella violaceinigra]
MRLSKYRPLIAALGLALALPVPAHASNDGDLCKGPAILICVPIALVAGIAHVLTPRSADEHLWDAIRDGDLDDFKHWLKKRGDLSEKDKLGYLSYCADEYMREVKPEKRAARLDMVKHLVEGMDMSGEAGTVALQKAVSTQSYGVEAPQNYQDRKLALAGFAIERGAKADAVDFGNCARCEAVNELLSMLVKNGAKLDQHKPHEAPLLNSLVNAGEFAAAQRAILLGANPNGGIWRQRGMLASVAARCDVDAMRKSIAAERLEAVWQDCVQQTVEFTTFAVQHGADANGNAGVATPYQTARKAQNEELAKALLQLGAEAR